jgi:ABC-type multidrug transport system permease subunit
MFLVIGHQQMVPALIDERLIFYRERGAKAYGAVSYWLTNWLIQLPLIIFNTVFFASIVYHLVCLNPAPQAFGVYYTVMLATSLCGYFIANLVAAIAPSTQAALSYYPVVLLFSVSFAGFLLYIPRFPAWLGNWAPYVSFMRYSFQTLVLNEFEGNDELPLGDQYISLLGFESLNIDQCISVLFLFVVVYSVSFLLATKYLNFEER